MLTTVRKQAPTKRHRKHRRPSPLQEVEAIVRWYLANAYTRSEGPGTLPFYADTTRVGRFAVGVEAIAARDPEALFRLLILLASYQSRRDVDIMAIQRKMPARSVLALSSPRRLRILLDSAPCPHLRSASEFDERCDVRRDPRRKYASCMSRPRTPCHVKDATMAIGRMGDMGKMSTSAWLHLGANGLERWFDETCEASADPRTRAAELVRRISTLYRIGQKLASMFVSALSVVELSGLAPWWPEIDGSETLVIDGNVARAIQTWRPEGVRTYAALATWLIGIGRQIDLSQYQRTLPRHSPRLVQQAIYVFRSRSNRTALGDPCETSRCASCPSIVCPFRT